jgi:hypothetical protein
MAPSTINVSGRSRMAIFLRAETQAEASVRRQPQQRSRLAGFRFSPRSLLKMLRETLLDLRIGSTPET